MELIFFKHSTPKTLVYIRFKSDLGVGISWYRDWKFQVRRQTLPWQLWTNSPWHGYHGSGGLDIGPFGIFWQNWDIRPLLAKLQAKKDLVCNKSRVYMYITRARVRAYVLGARGYVARYLHQKK